MATNIFNTEEYRKSFDEIAVNAENVAKIVADATASQKVSWEQLQQELNRIHRTILRDDKEFANASQLIYKEYFRGLSYAEEEYAKHIQALEVAIRADRQRTAEETEQVLNRAKESYKNYIDSTNALKVSLEESSYKIEALQGALSNAKFNNDTVLAIELQKELNRAQETFAAQSRMAFQNSIEYSTSLAETQKRAWIELEKEREAALQKANSQAARDRINIRYDAREESLGIHAPTSSAYQRQQAQINYNNQNVSQMISTVGPILQGGGYTGLSPLFDTATNKLSNSGQFGSFLSNVLRIVKGLAENILSRMDAAYRVLQQSIEQSNDLIATLKGDIDTRLQGLEETLDFKGIVGDLMTNAYNSSLINQKTYMDNISKLVDDGVAYNLEERAVLMTLSDRIATTFDALDKNLERLIRLQQADMTASQLGSEASLTAFLNRQFNDTSYLSGAYDNVSATLLEASAQMNIDQATSFMYAAQKWLGSLYALGMSDQAVNTIAQGLSYLSTGNVNQLNSNNSMQTMFAMAAENANISYSSILTNGLSADTVDALLSSMVQYLGQIANNTSGNQVTKAQWADILGLSVSDLRAISNLTQADLDAIRQQGNLGYNEARTETQQQLKYDVAGRMSAQELISNVLENAVFQRGMALSMSPNDVMQYMYEQFAQQFEGNGSVVEKFGHWLQNLIRLDKTNGMTVVDYKDALLAAAAMVAPDTVSSIAGKVQGVSDRISQLGENNYGTGQWIASALLGGPLGAAALGTANLIQNMQGPWGNDEYGNQFASGVLRNQIGQLNLQSWNSTLYNQNRGRNFAGLSPTAVGLAADLMDLESYVNPFVQTTSASSSVASSLADNIVTSFDAVQEAVESSATAVSSINEETTDSMEKLYHMLFEEQSIPIKVYLEGLSDELKENIDEFYDRNNLNLGDALANAIGRDASISSMINMIQSLKGV